MSLNTKEKGVSSLLLVVILLTLAILIPVVAKIVENRSLDNRGKADYGSSCVYTSFQSRVQPNSTVAWTPTLTIALGGSANLLCANNGTGLAATNVRITAKHTDSTEVVFDTGLRSNWVPTKAGTYTITCKALAAECNGLTSDVSTLVVTGGEPTRINACSSSTISTQSIGPGETAVVSIAANRSDIKRFWLGFYNLDNLFSANNPKPIYVSGTTNYIKAFDSTGEANHTFVLTYDDFDKPDLNNGGVKPTRIQMSGYFSIANGDWSYPTANCVKTLTIEREPTRINACSSSTISTQSIGPGETAVVSIAANRSDIKRFWLGFYNLDNLFSANNPKPIYVSGTTNYIKAFDSTGEANHTFVLTYDDFDKPDLNNGGVKPTRIQMSGYFSIANGDWSYPTANCVKTLGISRPTAPTSGPDTRSSVIRFKMAFSGLVANAKCAVNWPLQLTVLGNGVTKTYSGLVPTREGVVNSKVEYSLAKVLDGFTNTSGVAVFLKGPKHLQVKYGQDAQTVMYNQAGGVLTLVKDGEVANGPYYNFAGYPLLAGDVNQDGIINGQDFSIVKTKALRFDRVNEGGDLDADLDGDCVATNNDVQILRISLQEKLGQLY